MTVAIMQPYFFPYLGYFQLISAVDKWVVFDTPQYIRHGWINRNRILKPDRNDFQYINVPLKKHPREASINEVQIAETGNWRVKLLGQLEHYKKVAPFFLSTIEIVNQSIDIVTNSIVELNCNVLKIICDYLGIRFNYEVYSAMNLKHENPQHAGEWALHISSALGAKSYINPPGGVELFDKSQFDKAGIKLHFIEPQLRQYNQKNDLFIPGLSIIDVLMFNGVTHIKDEINKFKIINA
jgi:hypothetical protein